MRSAACTNILSYDFSWQKSALIFLTALALALVFGANSPAAATVVTEVYGTAADGTILHWVAHTPSTPGPWPAVLVIHGGGFDAGTPNDSAESVICAQDLADAGYLALSIEYRLAPPGRLSGQIASGRFPDQPDDIKVAVRAARSDSRSTGQVGSAGGAHTAFAATTGTKGDDRIDVGVSLSGAYDFTDFSSNPGLATIRRK